MNRAPLAGQRVWVRHPIQLHHTPQAVPFAAQLFRRRHVPFHRAKRRMDRLDVYLTFGGVGGLKRGQN